MKGSTQPMKRLLVLLPLLLVGCTNDKISDNSHTYNSKDVIFNVYYAYNFDSKNYEIILSEKEKYNVHPGNYYYIQIYEWSYTDDHQLIYNEFYVKSLELFVYYKK